MKSTVAVVILNWNGQKHLETYLPSVVKYSQNAIIYIADNCSTDNSITFLKENYPALKLIQNESNGGFAKGYNDALENLNEDYFVLLNSDVEVTPNWIKPVVEYLEQSENAVIAQPKLLSYLEKDKFEYAGAAGGYIDYLGYPFCRGRIFQEMEVDEGQYDHTTEVFWASGACMFIKSAVFKKLGGFDERFFAHMEEIDLCWRAKNLGYAVYSIPESVVYHLGGGTLQTNNPRKTFLNFRNSLLTLKKNDQSGFTWVKIFIRLLLDGLAFFKILKDSGLKHASAILKAHFSFYSMSTTKSESLQNNLIGMYNKSIVAGYFLKKKKHFSQLK